MTKTLVCLFIFMSVVDAHGAPKVPRQHKPVQPSDKKSPKSNSEPAQAATHSAPSRGRFYVSASYSSANQIHYRGKVDLFGTPTSFTATEKTVSAAGLESGYLLRRPSDFGFGGFLVYELPRRSGDIDGMAGDSTVHGTYQGEVTRSLLVGGANGNYSFGRSVYAFAGLNFPVILSKGSAQSLSGLVGYQAGLGYAFTAHFSADIGYRMVRLKGSLDSPPFNLEIDEASFPGFVLGLKYFFGAD